jgi:hypothetical protein
MAVLKIIPQKHRGLIRVVTDKASVGATRVKVSVSPRATLSTGWDQQDLTGSDIVGIGNIVVCS